MVARRDPILSETLSSALGDYLTTVRSRILDRATEIASTSQVPKDHPDRVALELVHLSKAIEDIAPSEPRLTDIGFPGRILDWLTSFTGVAAMLAIAFAVLGLVPSLASKGGDGGKAFLDIAKIFAGAVVGSASAPAIPRGRVSSRNKP
jgi:hypothetical protein